MAAAAGTKILMADTKELTEPEVHVFGEIIGASGVHVPDNNAFCAFVIEKGSKWTCVGGDESGQTQVDYPKNAKTGLMVWNHPLDVHYYTNTVQEWPRIVCHLWTLDTFGQKQLLGYGHAIFPSTGGTHELEIPCWRPIGTPKEEVYAYYLGSTPHLLNKQLIHNTTEAEYKRTRLTTTSVGKIHCRVDVLLRNTKPHHIKDNSK